MRLSVGWALALASIAPPLVAQTPPEAAPLATPAPLTPADAARAIALGEEAIALELAGKPAEAVPKWTALDAITAARWPGAVPTKHSPRDAEAATVAYKAGDWAEVGLLRLADAAMTRRIGLDELRHVAREIGLYAEMRAKLGEQAKAEAIWRGLANAPDAETQADMLGLFGSMMYDRIEAGDLAASERLAGLAIELYAGRPRYDHDSLFGVRRQYGDVLALQGRYADAEAQYAAALGLSGIGTDKPDDLLGHLVDSYAATLAVQGKGEAAVALLKRAKPADTDTPQELVQQIDAANSIRLGQVRPRESIALQRLQIAMLEGRTDEFSVNTRTMAINNLGAALSGQGDYAEAETLFRRNLTHYERCCGTDSYGAIGASENLAAILTNVGRRDEALALYQRIWAIKTKEADYGDFDTATALRRLTRILIATGRATDASETYRTALAKFEALSERPPEVAANYYLGAAEVAEATDQPQLDWIRKATTAKEDYSTVVSLANILVDEGGFEEARRLYDRALRLIADDVMSGGAFGEQRATIEQGLARIAARSGNIAEADRRFAALESGARAQFGPGSESAIGAAFDRARWLIESGRPALALAPARATLAGRLAIRDRLGADSSAGSLASATGFAAFMAARAALAAGNRDEAFGAAQLAGQSSAADALARSAAETLAARVGAAAAVSDWRARQDRLRLIDTDIADQARQGEAGDVRRRQLLAQRESAATGLAASEAALRTRFPAFFDLIKTTPTSLADLRALLRGDEALLLMVPGLPALEGEARRGIVFAVTREGAAASDIGLAPDALAAEIAALHDQLARGGETALEDTAPPPVIYARSRAFALHQALFGTPEIAALIGGKPRLLLAPQGALMSLPFAALVTAPPPGGTEGDTDPASLRATSWLGLQKTLSVLPAVSSLAIERGGSGGETGGQRIPFFGVGDPAFSGRADPPITEVARERGVVRAVESPVNAASYRRGAGADRAAIATLKRLPHTSSEVRALARSLGASGDAVLLQTDATEAAIRARERAGTLGRTDVIAFATHGLVAGSLALAEPALALSPPAGEGMTDPANDGLLTASEAAALKLSARHVILSACNTAAGGSPDADSLSGLARAFFFAGARSLIVSHFPVFDDAAERLTTHAARLSRERSIGTAEAMREAMTALAADTSLDAEGYSLAHPKAWAPFAVVDAR